MASATIVKQVLENGARNYAALFTSVFAAGDTISNYLALNPTSGGDMGVSFAGNTLYPDTHLKIVDLQYELSDGLALQLIWDASSAQTAYIVTGLGGGTGKFRKSGGLFVPQSAGAPIAGATGKLLFTLQGTPSAGQVLSIHIQARKDIAQ